MMRKKQLLTTLAELAEQGLQIPDGVFSDGWRGELAALAGFSNEAVVRVLVLRRQQQLLADREVPAKPSASHTCEALECRRMETQLLQSSTSR